VERRIEQADGDRQPGHDPEDLLEVAALLGKQLGERGAAALLAVGQDHLANRGDPRGIEEHVLGAAQADALGAEFARGAAIVRGLGIGADARRRTLSAQTMSVPKSPTSSAALVGTWPEHHLAGRAVDGDDLVFLTSTRPTFMRRALRSI
jgi:hypothetical protein